MWTQYKAETSSNALSKISSTFVFWKNEHGEIDMDNIGYKDLSAFLAAISNGHSVECDSTGNTFKEEEC